MLRFDVEGKLKRSLITRQTVMGLAVLRLGIKRNID